MTTTITTHMDDLEYAHCTGDSDRYLTLVPGHELGGKGKLMVRETNNSAGLRDSVTGKDLRSDIASPSSS